jgi:RHS repeat-associated protein
MFGSRSTNWTSASSPVARRVSGFVLTNPEVREVSGFVLTNPEPKKDLHGLNIDEPLAMLRSGATSYYEADGLGSITSLSNSSGSVVQTYNYYGVTSFGTHSSSGSITNPFRFTAREYDETGLYFYRARYYDPQSGRFLSEDPIRFAGDTGSFYRYVRNRPTYFRDPSGLLSIGPGFSAQCLADLLQAIQILKGHAKDHPACDCWYRQHGSHIPLFVFLDNPLYSVNFDPKGNNEPGEANTLAYTLSGRPFDVFVTPSGCSSGPTHIAQDLAHEFGHLELGHYMPWYDKLSHNQESHEHNKVRILENTCGFALQTPGTSITVTAQ